LKAEAAIRRLASRYAFAVDDRDYPALGALFDSPVRLVLRGGRTGEGKEEILTMYRHAMPRTDLRYHDRYRKTGEGSLIAERVLEARANRKIGGHGAG
jgi:hypothetical protein